MKDDSDNTLNPEDDLKASNEILKLKLELEHGMAMSDAKSLTPEGENKWLNYIYNFEQQHKNAKQVKVYDFIGRPDFVRYDALDKKQISEALERISSIMEEKGIELDCCCEYDDVVIYRFITEELFDHEMEEVVIEGMVHHFIYEEFHPNHDYDLRRIAKEFIESLLQKKWDKEFDDIHLANIVSFKDVDYDSERISSIILTFQEAHPSLKLVKFEIHQVNFDIEKEEATVQGNVSYSGVFPEVNGILEGACVLHFSMDWSYWKIRSFQLSGFTA